MSNVVLQKIGQVDRKVKYVASTSKTCVPEQVDKVFEWLPAIYVLLADIPGNKTSSSFKKRVFIILATQLVADAFISPLKKYIHRRRPGYFLKTNSFPSRHAAISFSGAHILRNQLTAVPRLLSYSGYLSAVTTASLRIYRRRHWLTDVIAGAVIGLIASKIVHTIFKDSK